MILDHCIIELITHCGFDRQTVANIEFFLCFQKMVRIAALSMPNGFIISLRDYLNYLRIFFAAVDLMIQ